MKYLRKIALSVIILFMNDLDNDIRNKTFKNVYLLYGTDGYLKRNYRDFLLKGLLPDGMGDSMNFTVFDGAPLDVKALISQAQTMPFFADYRVILVKESGIFSDKGRKDDRDALGEYLSAPDETVRLIFVETDVKKTYKAYKEIEKKDGAFLLKTWTGERLKNWIINKFQKAGLSITADAYAEFTARTSENTDGSDIMQYMDNEISKLIAYCSDKGAVEISDVREIVSGQVNAKVFALVDAIVEKNEKEVMRLYSDLKITREAPEKIISLLEQQLMQLLSSESMFASNASNDEMVKVLRYDWMIGKNRRLLSRIGREELLSILKKAEDYEYRLKSGRIDRDIALEALLVEAVRR